MRSSNCTRLPTDGKDKEIEKYGVIGNTHTQFFMIGLYTFLWCYFSVGIRVMRKNSCVPLLSRTGSKRSGSRSISDVYENVQTNLR